jgi:hypothetical protein
MLCVAKGYGTKHSSSLVKYNKYIPIEDEEEADLSPHLPVGVAFIADKLKITNVFTLGCRFWCTALLGLTGPQSSPWPSS